MENAPGDVFDSMKSRDLAESPPAPNTIYMLVLYITDLCGRLILIALAILFAIRVAFAKKQHRSEEQAWAVMMLVTTAISYTPALNIQALHDNYIVGNARHLVWTRFRWFVDLVIWSRIVNLFFASFGQLFYLWACAHSYSFLEGKGERPSRLRFYGPKLLLLLTYGVFRLLLRLQFGLSPSKLPFVTTIAMLRNFHTLNHWPMKSLIVISCYTALEFVICFVIGRRILITQRVLREAEYLKYRSKQLGFRFFLVQNISGYALFLAADCTILISTPRDFSIVRKLSVPFAHLLYNFRFGPIPRLLNYATTAMTAYVNLPADSVGFMGWIRGSKIQADIDRKPYTLKLRQEADDLQNIIQDASTLHFESQIDLFNLSYLAYGLKSNAESRIKSNKYIKDEGYAQDLLFEHEENHTLVVILSREDSIVVAFRGTSDMEQAKTDIKVLMEPLSDTIPSRKETPDDRTIDSWLWKSAKVHKGFASAYNSVSELIIEKISELLSGSARPICITGHSLGGALATLCSLDILTSLGHQQIYVTTFGSPKCGNMYWRKLYDNLIQNHWRFAMRTDIVTTIPRLGYNHVGKRVALTNTGEIFLDPNAIETMMWPSTGVGITDHRIHAYEEALEKFCGKYLPNFLPQILSKKEDPKTCRNTPISRFFGADS